jgi:hypothetical protein
MRVAYTLRLRKEEKAYIKKDNNDAEVGMGANAGCVMHLRARFTPLEIRIIISCHIHGAYSLTG